MMIKLKTFDVADVEDRIALLTPEPSIDLLCYSEIFNIRYDG